MGEGDRAASGPIRLILGCNGCPSSRIMFIRDATSRLVVEAALATGLPHVITDYTGHSESIGLTHMECMQASSCCFTRQISEACTTIRQILESAGARAYIMNDDN